MFNRGSFNRQKFNLASSTTDIAVREQLEEKVNCTASAGENIYASLDAMEETQASSVLSASVSAGMSLDEIVDAESSGVCDYHTSELQEEEVGSEINVGADIHVIGTASEAVSASLNLGEDIHLEVIASSAFLADLTLGADYTVSPILCFEIMNAMVSSAIFDTLYINVDVTIPVGGKLVIDSNDFIVLLDNVNVLDKHSGSWLDLERSVSEIVVDSGSTATMAVKMLYTELWL